MRITRLLASLAAAVAFVAGSPVQARADVDPCFENAHKADNPDAFGLKWYSTRSLDVDEYLGCFKPSAPPNGYGPVAGKMAVLGSTGAWVQNGPQADLFTLRTLKVGTGWNTGATLTFEGFLHGVSQGVRSVNLIAGDSVSFNFVGMNTTFTHFTLSADYSTASDPFNSAALQADAGGPNEPYKTFYVVGAVVPEPGTFGLVAAGLAGLAAVARRRRSTK